MGIFKNWIESTARSRAKAAASKGLGAKMAGAETHAHRTEPEVEKSVGKNGEIGDKPLFGKPKGKKNKHPKFDLPEDEDKDKDEDIKEDQMPDRSFDAFVKKAEDLKNSIPEIMKRAKTKEGELDKKDTELKSDSESPHDEEDIEGKEKTWKDLQQLAKDKEDSEEKSSDSDGAT
jgi:hypothetical protein